MEHIFNIEVAKQYGVHAAVILKNIQFWIEKNKANEKHYYKERYWTYNSKSAFERLFPYLTYNKIRRALELLKSEGLILTDNFNKNVYDKTLWYSLSDKGIQLCSNKGNSIGQ